MKIVSNILTEYTVADLFIDGFQIPSKYICDAAYKDGIFSVTDSVKNIICDGFFKDFRHKFPPQKRVFLVVILSHCIAKLVALYHVNSRNV